jgi:ribosome biogenesis GTPase / thiamine phosphate phosphatase
MSKWHTTYMENLERYGWNDYFAAQMKDETLVGYTPARVMADFGSMLKIVTPEERTATISGRLMHNSSAAALPKVGDWVAVQYIGGHEAIIEAVLQRKSEIARRAAGVKTVKQVMAANVDIAFVVQSLDNDFSPERLQRYLYQLAVSHVQPVILLNKADTATDLSSYVATMQSLDLPCIVCSAKTGAGVDRVTQLIAPGRTAVLIGSSGVGKSTLTNRLTGEDSQKTQEVSTVDGTGRHTTIHRQLFVLPNGGLLIDTPGIRELQLWGIEEGLAENFDDILTLAAGCKYTTCRHGTESGCAVQAALASGKLAQAHYANYLKMKRELQRLAAITNEQAARQNKKTSPVASRRANKHNYSLTDED